MNVIGRMVGWLGRKAILYAVLVVAILGATFVVPWVRAEWAGAEIHAARALGLETVQRQVRRAQDEATLRLARAAEGAGGRSIAEIDRAVGDARRARAGAVSELRGTGAQLASLARVDIDAILADRARELEIRFRDGEIAALEAARERLVLQGAAGRAEALRGGAVGAAAACRTANDRVAAFERRWIVRLTLQQYQARQLAALKRERDGRCASANAMAEAARAAIAEAGRQRDEAVRAAGIARGAAEGLAASATADLDQRIVAERTAANGSWRAKAAVWAERVRLGAVLTSAAVALAVIIVSPFLVRLVCYYVLAPVAMRRAAIRVSVPGGRGVAVLPAGRSTTSVAVRLEAGEELLVRQDYLQTTSHAGAKSTQWLLDRRHPFTSIATGLTFLTRIGGEGEVTTVSAVRDPFAEVAILTLPEGAACVLQPRAIAAVVQPAGRRLRVTSHWRLFSLNAWLTLQLRYLVFHGPARIVVKGGRGVRVERAERGRIFGQDQLVGFSADLAYSVTRTETAWPYLLGRETLLKDRVEAGEGVLIVEEAPLAGRGGAAPKRGIEGMIDAAMKTLGM